MGIANTPTAPTAPKLMDQVTERLRTNHYSIRTEKQYVQWIRRYIFSTASAILGKWALPKWRRF